jgi:hypothetical protein
MHNLMGDKPYTIGAMSYIYQKAGESITNQVADMEDQIEDENTTWGLMYEPEALSKFQSVMGVKYLATQKLISNEKKQFSSTPDAIWIHNECLSGEEYNVSTAEVKCPRKYHKFFPLHACKTPQQLKDFSKHYYWQVLDQMDNCGSAVGYFVCYHPLFPPATNMRIIEFRKIDLWDDFKFLTQRKAMAVSKFNELKLEFGSSTPLYVTSA